MSDDKGYGDMKEFVCTGCGKKITLTKFASQKTCKCDECKAKNIPINPEIVKQALMSNPPKERTRVETHDGDGATKDRPCVQCGTMVTVSKFMSDKKVLCNKCKGVDGPGHMEHTTGRLQVDLSKLDRSKILPIEEYEVNQAVIANGRLRKVKCPACGHEYMKPLSVADWSQFGLIITYQCTECYLTMTISEQCGRLLKQFDPGTRFDYTGEQINELGMSYKDHSRLANSVLLLIKKLRENNIELGDEVGFPPYRWNNEKPVPTGFIIPEEDRWIHLVDEVIRLFSAQSDDGPILVQSDIATRIAEQFKNLLKGE